MDIDLNQLPIPDWNLQCPTCGYPVRGLPSHRCPECGTALEIPALVQPWTRLREPWFIGDELPIPDWGLECPVCDVPVAGLRAHQCLECGNDVRPALRPPGREWFVVERNHLRGLIPSQLEILLQHEYIPYLASEERTVREIYSGATWARRLRVPSEFYFDMLFVIQRELSTIAERRTAAPGPDWTCPACGETSPDHFAICWNCGAERD